MRARPHRILPAVLLGVACLMLSGCVYLRLLQLKNQLADFDRNVEADTRDGLKLTFKKPVVLDEDFENFFKWVPEARQRVGSAEKWRFRWVKDRVAADGDRPPPELELDFYFSEHKLAKIAAPESFFAAVMPKALVLSMLRSMGKAKIDQKNRSATATLETKDSELALLTPTRAMLTAFFGAPVEVSGDETEPKWRYRFTAASPAQNFGKKGNIDVTFTLSSESGRVRHMKGESVGMTLSYPFPETDAAKAASTSFEQRLEQR